MQADVLAAMLLSLLHIACLLVLPCFFSGLGFASRAASDVCLKSRASACIVHMAFCEASQLAGWRSSNSGLCKSQPVQKRLSQCTA